MATTNYNLPTISGASPVAIVDDYNALANATDAALAGAISGEKTRAMAAETELANGVSNALTTASSANVSASDAKSAADKAQTTASTALTNAATAQTTADGARSAVDALAKEVSTANEHLYFENVSPHANNPWPAGAWSCRESRDNTRVEINGFCGIRPAGGGLYAKNSDVINAAVSIPGTASSKGVPLFSLKHQPATAEDVRAGVLFSAASGTAYSYSNALTADIVIATDGVAYLLTHDSMLSTSNYTYGVANSGTWAIE